MSGILGILGAFAVIILANMADGDSISSLYSTTALIIVFGGTFASLLTQFGLRDLLRGLARFMWLISPPRIDILAFIDRVAEWSNLARSRGALALEEELQSTTDPFERQGLQMIIDNTDLNDLRPVLGVLAANATREDHAAGEVWEAAAGYSPTIGVLGAVLGLIHVMMELNHPDKLGAGIATAFVATVYGVGAANLIFLPLGSRLVGLADVRERQRHIMIQGFALLAEGKPGILIRQNLQNFLTKEMAKPAAEPQDSGVDDLEREAA